MLCLRHWKIEDGKKQSLAIAGDHPTAIWKPGFNISQYQMTQYPFPLKSNNSFQLRMIEKSLFHIGVISNQTKCQGQLES